MQETLSEVLSVQQEIRRRLDQVEKRSQVGMDPPPVREAAVEPVGSGAGAAPSRDGDGYDEEVEGLVSEWRRLKAQAAEARLELEIELIREHEMGIPPGERWGLGVRLREVSWRWGALTDRSRQRRRLALLPVGCGEFSPSACGGARAQQTEQTIWWVMGSNPCIRTVVR